MTNKQGFMKAYHAASKFIRNGEFQFSQIQVHHVDESEFPVGWEVEEYTTTTHRRFKTAKRTFGETEVMLFSRA